MRKLLTLSLLLLIVTGCSINVLNNMRVSNAITFELLKQDAYGGRDAKSTVIITSQSQLQELYKELGWGSVPAVDFGKNNVVALFMGQKSTGGYSINVRKVTVEDDTATVEALETSPEGMATMALTAPYCIVVIPKTANVVVK